MSAYVQEVKRAFLEEYLIPKGAQVLAGLQDALDDGHCVCQSLHLLQ